MSPRAHGIGRRTWMVLGRVEWEQLPDTKGWQLGVKIPDAGSLGPLPVPKGRPGATGSESVL